MFLCQLPNFRTRTGEEFMHYAFTILIFVCLEMLLFLYDFFNLAESNCMFLYGYSRFYLM